jgi:hypothetical protein
MTDVRHWEQLAEVVLSKQQRPDLHQEKHDGDSQQKSQEMSHIRLVHA